MELPFGRNPAHRSILPDNPKLRRVRIPALPRFRDCLCDQRAILCVHVTIKIFCSAHKGLGGYSENALQVTEPGISSALQIPLPSYGPTGLHRETQPAVGQGKFLFLHLALGDIRGHAYNPQHLPVFVKVCTTGSIQPDHFTVGAHHSIADMKVRVFRAKRSHSGEESFPVVWVNVSRCLLTGSPRGVLDPEDLAGFWRAHEGIGDSIPLVGEHLSGFSRQMKPFFAVAQYLFPSLAFRHINATPDVTHKRAILIKPRHPNVDNPSILSVVPSEPILHSELLTPIRGLPVRVQASLQILGVNTLRPAVPYLEVNGSPGEIQPRLIEVGAQLVRV